MCSYNAVLGKPTCLSPLIRNARRAWGFEGYVTSDSDSVANAWTSHHYPQPFPTPVKATALALKEGQCDINSGDTCVLIGFWRLIDSPIHPTNVVIRKVCGSSND